MPRGLKRFQHSGQTHFITFTCYHRRPSLGSSDRRDLFIEVLENMRRQFDLCIYAFVVMPEHVHLLLNEPGEGLLADAIHYLKLSYTKRLNHQGGHNGVFWQKRYYDRNVRNEREFLKKLRYTHRNPVSEA